MLFSIRTSSRNLRRERRRTGDSHVRPRYDLGSLLDVRFEFGQENTEFQTKVKFGSVVLSCRHSGRCTAAASTGTAASTASFGSTVRLGVADAYLPSARRLPARRASSRA